MSNPYLEEQSTGLISIRQAEARGLTKLRLDVWANPDDYLEFTMVEFGGVGFGPWVKLWSPTNAICEQENPQMLLITMIGDLDDECWRPLPKELVRKQ